MADYRRTRVLVLGLGETGLSMARWLCHRGAEVRVADTRRSPPNLEVLRRELPGVAVHCGGFPEAAFAGIDLVAISPGVPLADPALTAAVAKGVSVVGDIELFAREIPAAETPRILAITGTNGKSTVTALAGEMCRAAGLACEVAGNIGPAALEALIRCESEGRAPQAWVLELSSFQLETTASLDASASAMLNVTEDHLDRYRSIEEYAAAKARIFRGRGAQVLNRDDPRSMAMAATGRAHFTFGLNAPVRPEDYGVVDRAGALWLAQGKLALIPLAEMRLAGLHNAANALAALALCRAIGLPFEPLLAALREFRGLPHRVEPAGEARGVRFYDDSKGTNVGATVAALAGFAQTGTRVALIAGGEGKSQDFSPLADAVSNCARAVVLIGRDAPLIERAIRGSGVPVSRANSMDEAVALAAAAARPGDVVLLSPACASFDMFRSYAHRGDAFRDAVQRLAHGTNH